MTKNTLLVSEIFYSISGEAGAFKQGSPTIFIRLGGCNLNCDFCDATSSIPLKQDHYRRMTYAEIMQEIKKYKCEQVLITGGEPLIQLESLRNFIYDHLHPRLYEVQIETNGTIPLKIKYVHWVVDYKPEYCLKEGMQERRFGPVGYPLNTTIKFVICSTTDYDIATREIRKLHAKREDLNFALSPVNEHTKNYSAPLLMKMMMYDCLPKTILNVQIHKYINAQ